MQKKTNLQQETGEKSHEIIFIYKGHSNKTFLREVTAVTSEILPELPLNNQHCEKEPNSVAFLWLAMNNKSVTQSTRVWQLPPTAGSHSRSSSPSPAAHSQSSSQYEMAPQELQRSHLAHSCSPPCLEPVLVFLHLPDRHTSGAESSFQGMQVGKVGGTKHKLVLTLSALTQRGEKSFPESHSWLLVMWSSSLRGLPHPSAEQGIHHPWVFRQRRIHEEDLFLPGAFSNKEKTTNLLLWRASCSTVKKPVREVFCEAWPKETRNQRKWGQNTMRHYRWWLKGWDRRRKEVKTGKQMGDREENLQLPPKNCWVTFEMLICTWG